MKYLILITLLAHQVSACKSSQKTTSTEKHAMQEKVNTLVVSFISIGTGIDIETKQKFDKALTSFEQGQNVELNVEKVPWGREGEIDYCFEFSNLTDEQVHNFLDKISNILSNNELVQMQENAPCVHKR